MLSGITQQAALGRFLLKDCFPAIAPAAEVFEQSVKALNNSSENISAYHPLLKKHFSITTAKVNDGILVIARDITIQITAEKKMHEQSAFLNGILNASINAVFVCNAIIDADGKIIDFCIVKINRAFSVLTGKLPGEVEGAAYSSLFPEATSAGLFEMNCMVIETGEPLRKEVYYKDEYIDAWFDISLVRIRDNALLATFTDITPARQSLLQIKNQKTLLDNILKYSPSGIAVVKLIRDADGKAADGFAIVANDAASAITGILQEILKNKISEVDPKIIANPLFQIALSALQAGKPFLTQYFLKSSGKWLELGISKIDDEHTWLLFLLISPLLK